MTLPKYTIMRNIIYYFLQSFLLVLLSICTTDLIAQFDSDCREDTLVLNTGYSPFTNMALPIGVTDFRWIVTQDPDPGTTEPRPAWTIPAYPSWQPAMPNTQWISSYPTSNNDRNGDCLLYTSPSPRDLSTSRMPSSA